MTARGTTWHSDEEAVELIIQDGQILINKVIEVVFRFAGSQNNLKTDPAVV